MDDDLRAEVESLRAEVESLKVNVHGPGQLWALVRDHDERFQTLQTPLLRRILFRADGWPGRRDLNADRPRWRPWRRWWTS